jgi:hypothetical protein
MEYECDDEEEQARTAYHEAGHSVMAVLCGAQVCRASISPEESLRHGEVEIHWPRHSKAEDQLATILSGPVAEMIYRSEPLHPGLVEQWGQDWKQAWEIARPRCPTDRRCLQMLEQLVVQLHKSLSQDRYWSAIAAVQDLLMAHEEISHEEIEYEVNAWLR